MKRFTFRFVVAAMWILFAAASHPAWAQTETGRIAGTVTDVQGGVIPGVTVTAKSVAAGTSRTTVTDSSGNYVIANIPADTYDVTFELSGFKTVKTRTQVSVGSTVGADARIEVGAVTEQVTVTAAPPTIDTQTGEFKTTISTRQLTELPTLTRNPYDLVALAGNVKENSAATVDLVGGNGGGTGFSINGQRPQSTNVLLDGGDNNYLFSADVGQEVPLDSVQEFSVITNNFSAQYGHASGGIVNVITKSGTNSFSGTAYEFFRNDAMSANTPDNEAKNLEKGVFKRNQPGYSFGGPIKKDKVHFFSGLEYIGIRSSDNLSGWVVTPQFLGAISPTAKAYFDTYGKQVTANGPILTRGDVSALLGAGTGAFSQLPASLPVFQRADVQIPTDAGAGFPGDEYQTVNRMDFSLGPNSQAYVRYAYQHSNTDPGTQSSSVYSNYNTGTSERNHNVNGSFTQVWKSNLTSQSKVVWNKLDQEQPVNGPAEPRLMMNPSRSIQLQGDPITFPGYYPYSPSADIPAGGPQSLLQLYHDQTWLKGAHDFRFGGSFVHINDDHTFSAYSNAVEALNSGNAALPALDNLVLGQIGRFQKAINPQGYPGGTFVTPVEFPSFLSHNRYNEFALYANDNWSVGSRLKINLGMRYEYFGPQNKSDPKYDSNFYWADPNLDLSTASPQAVIASVANGKVYPSNESPLGTLWKSDWNNWGPRLGFAWDVNGDGRSAIRGGYGISYERNFGNVTYNVLFNPPLYLVATIDSPQDVPSQPIYVDNGGPFTGTPGVTKTIPAGSLRHVDQNIKTAYAHIYGVSYTRELGSRMTGSVEYNGSTGRDLYDLADVNKRGASLIYLGTGTATSRPNPQYGAFNTRGNRGRSQYHGATFSLDAREFGKTGVAFTSRYTLSQAKDNLSDTFSRGDNTGYFAAVPGYLDAFDPMLDYGYAGFDVRHRLSLSGIWSLPWGGTNTWKGGWQMNAILTASSGYPLTVFDCTNFGSYCMRAEDPIGIDRNVTSGTPTGEPNEYTLLDLAPLVPFAGNYKNPLTGNADFGPYPADMTKRGDFRGPGAWTIDYSVGKRFHFGNNKAVLARLEVYNLFNHHNMYPHGDTADVSNGPTSAITGYKSDWRRMQVGIKYEF